MHISLGWLDLCFCDSLSFAGVTIQELAPGSETGQAAIPLGDSCQGCAEDRQVSVSVNATKHRAGYCCSQPVQNALLDHTDPGMGIKLISKGQEKQPAGQPKLFLPGSLQIILASISKEKSRSLM